MKTFLILSLMVLWSASVHAELRIIGVRVTRDADSKVQVAISSDVAKEQMKNITVEQAAIVLRDTKGAGSSVMVGIVAHGIPLQEYLPLMKAISENIILELAFVEGSKPTFINENIKKSIEQAAPSNGDKLVK